MSLLKKILIIIIILFSAIPTGLYINYNLDLWIIKYKLSQIENITAIKVDGEHHTFKINEIYAEVRYKNDKNIVFWNLTKDCFDSTDRINLIGFDNWTVELCGWTRENNKDTNATFFLNNKFAFGSERPFSKLIPVKVKNVQQLIENYDLIAKCLDSLPKYPKWGTIVTEKSYVFYQIHDKSLDVINCKDCITHLVMSGKIKPERITTPNKKYAIP